MTAIGGISAISILLCCVATADISTIIPDNIDKNRSGLCVQAEFKSDTTIKDLRCVYLDGQETSIENPTTGENNDNSNGENNEGGETENPPIIEDNSDKSIMRMTWDTSLSESCNIISLPTGNLPEGVTVTWGDKGETNSNISPDLSDVNGEIDITIKGSFSRWSSPSGMENNSRADMPCLVSINEWNNSSITIMDSGFENANNLKSVKEIPSSVKRLSNLFMNSEANVDVSSWNFDNVTSINNMFNNNLKYDTPVKINAPKLLEARGLFADAKNFNKEVIINAPNLKDVSEMFSGASKFNSNVEINSNSIENAYQIFYKATNFNKPFSLNDSPVLNLGESFYGATNFNSPLTINTSKTTIMTSMFYKAKAFNQDVSGWDTSNVINMRSMFDGTTTNQDLSGWNVNKVISYGSFKAGNINWTKPIPNFK